MPGQAAPAGSGWAGPEASRPAQSGRHDRGGEGRRSRNGHHALAAWQSTCRCRLRARCRIEAKRSCRHGKRPRPAPEADGQWEKRKKRPPGGERFDTLRFARLGAPLVFYAVTDWRWPACSPSQISSTILALKSPRSSGERDVTRPASTTTDWSSTRAPAFFRSCWID